ncbi:hypothetical protein FRC08_015378 [Ceratobasidium sp. 394]|nr:hypothetical protein FRC08_015378 [Ceratobasidium sp. 394]
MHSGNWKLDKVPATTAKSLYRAIYLARRLAINRNGFQVARFQIRLGKSKSPLLKLFMQILAMQILAFDCISKQTSPKPLPPKDILVSSLSSYSAQLLESAWFGKLLSVKVLLSRRAGRFRSSMTS